MTCLIIEDEAPAQRILQRFIADTPGLELLATFNNPLEGMEWLSSASVDLLFLDINLPKLSGIDLLRSLSDPPKVILTTAYQEFAFEGFELEVMDYLLKPFTFARFLRAINKVKKASTTDVVLEKAPNSSVTDQDFITVKSDKIFYRVRLTEILYVQAEGDFVRLVMENGVLLISRTLNAMESQLSTLGFLRIHRSYLLRLGALQKLEGNQVHTSQGVIPVGRSYRVNLLEVLDP